MISYIQPYIDQLLQSTFALIVLSVLLFAMLVQLFYYLYYDMAVVRRSKAAKKGRMGFSTEQVPVSIIICARNEEENLKQFLPKVLEQDYPNYEVIVVNDGSLDDTAEVLKQFETKYAHLRVTHIDRTPSSHKYVTSPKKMAVTIGVKAAENELLVFTDADCEPISNQWLKMMVRNFTPDTEFVLGYGGYQIKKGFVSRLVSYDTIYIGMQSLGMAYCGVPYMGVGRNMAYRKSTFFKMRGFAGHLHIASGDDDLIVNKGATGYNTNIEVDGQSKTVSVPCETLKEWLLQKNRHLTASSLYTVSSKMRLGLEPLTRALFYLSIIIAPITRLWALVAVALFCFLLRWLIQMIVINKVSNIFKDRHFYLSIPIFDIYLPLVNLWLMMASSLKRGDAKNTWGK